MEAHELLKTDEKLHQHLKDHLLSGRVEKLMIAYANLKTITDKENHNEKPYYCSSISQGWVDKKCLTKQCDGCKKAK